MNVTPNRPDALSHRGIARELAAKFNRPLKPLSYSLKESSESVNSRKELSVEPGAGCSRYVGRIIENVKVILERTPPELAADIYRHGVYLTGGASQVSGLAELLNKGTGLKVNMAENPIESVALGLSKVIKDDNYRTVAYSIEGMGNGGRL